MKVRHTGIALIMAAAVALLVTAVTPAAAETQTVRGQEPFSIFVPCANGGLGETVDGILKSHLVFGTTNDGAGGFHLHAQGKLQGVGIGSVTGDSYQLHADLPFFIFGDRINDNAGGSFNAALSFSGDAIGMGDAPNFHATIRFQVTYNANGVQTVDRAEMTEVCN